MKSKLGIALWILCALTIVGAQAENIVWQIGQTDRSAAEFALAPDYDPEYVTRFPNGCYYEVGISNPLAEWSYVLPGPRDNWAGSRSHTATLVFALNQAPSQACQLELAFVDTHNNAPPRLDITVNGQLHTLKLPAGGPDDPIKGDYSKGKPSLLTVALPAGQLHLGNNVIAIANKEGSWCIFDSLALKGPEGLTATAIQPDTLIVNATTTMVALRGPNDTCLSPVDLTVLNTREAVEVRFQTGSKTLKSATLQRGLNTIQLTVPAVASETALPLELILPGAAAIHTTATIQPVRKWEVHLIHQTHLDIGYTHPQEDVLKLQVDHLRKALAYIEASKDFPPEAQFKWHPEGMWAVEEFMRTATEPEKAALIAAARTGHIHLDAFYAQAMTCIYSDEELFELLASSKQFERDYQVPVVSATSSDIPGFAWGAVPVLAQNGVRYFSVAPNRVHRIGHVFNWGDKPFWWQSPSGQEKILFWMSGKDYSHFHGQPIGHRITPAEILPVLQEMQDKGYPYDLMHLRYNIGADNGPPNPVLPEVVREWNEKYVWPKLIISTNSAMFQEFEKRYGDQLPTLRGDFTGHWEDGAGSTAADTGIDRRARDRLVQAQTLWTMRQSATFPFVDFQQAWTDAIMYDEHTWGAWNSISDPDSEFAIRQAVYKQKFALDAAANTSRLLAQSLSATGSGDSSTINVYNTSNWPGTDLVLLTASQSKAGNQVVDDTNKTIPSQRLKDGSLAFVAKEVPPLGSKRYQIKSGPALLSGSAKASGLILSNSILSLIINPKNGAIGSLKTLPDNTEWVQPNTEGLNNYLYIIGRDAQKNHQLVENPITITVQDSGPLVASIIIESSAPGCNKLTRKLRLVDGLDTLAIENITDKLKERRPESVFFGFPINIAGGQWRLDIPWGIMRPELDQLPGANRNYFIIQRWSDLSNANAGLTIVSLDAPLVEFDPLVFERPFTKDDWRTECQPGQTFWSWVMNNHWETNYKADQEGIITFRYVLRPHTGSFDPVASEQLALQTCRPLLATQINPSQPIPQFPWKIEGKSIIVSAIKPIAPSGTLLRLFNPTSEPAVATLSATGQPLQVQHCTPIGEPLESLQPRLTLKPMEILNIRIDR